MLLIVFVRGIFAATWYVNLSRRFPTFSTSMRHIWVDKSQLLFSTFIPTILPQEPLTTHTKTTFKLTSHFFANKISFKRFLVSTLVCFPFTRLVIKSTTDIVTLHCPTWRHTNRQVNRRTDVVVRHGSCWQFLWKWRRTLLPFLRKQFSVSLTPRLKSAQAGDEK